MATAPTCWPPLQDNRDRPASQDGSPGFNNRPRNVRGAAMGKNLLLSALLSARKLALLVFESLAMASLARAQSVRAQQAQTGESAHSFQAVAASAERAPTIDGKDEDAVWQTAAPI